MTHRLAAGIDMDAVARVQHAVHTRPSWTHSSHSTLQRIDGQHAVPEVIKTFVSKGPPCTPACSSLPAESEPPRLVSALLAVVAPADESHVPSSLASAVTAAAPWDPARGEFADYSREFALLNASMHGHIAELQAHSLNASDVRLRAAALQRVARSLYWSPLTSCSSGLAPDTPFSPHGLKVGCPCDMRMPARWLELMHVVSAWLGQQLLDVGVAPAKVMKVLEPSITTLHAMSVLSLIHI